MYQDISHHIHDDEHHCYNYNQNMKKKNYFTRLSQQGSKTLYHSEF